MGVNFRVRTGSCRIAVSTTLRQAVGMDFTSPHNTPSDAPDAGSGPQKSRSGGSTDVEEHLHRCRDGRMVAGVAAGLADYFDVDPTLVRIGFVVLSCLGGLAVPLSPAGWLLVPEEGTDLSVAEELLARERAT